MRSKRRTIAWITTAVTVAVLATLLWTTGSVQAGPLAQVPLRITYQGRLTDSGGSPLTGNYDFYFGIYSLQSGGTLLWSETQSNVSVDNGTFTVQLGAVTALNPAHFDGSIRWLEVQVRQAGTGSFTTLTPRQQLVSVPYVLASGNHWGQTWTGSGTGLILSSSNGTGVEGRSSSSSYYGVYGITYSTSTGVRGYGANGSGTGGRGNGATYYALWGFHENSNGYALGVNQGQAVFNGYVTFNAGKSGYVVEIALNDDNVPLEQGDVVVISGYGSPVVGQVPVIKVRKATDAYATGVVGVVDVLYEVGPKLNLDQLENVAPSGGFRPEVTTIQPGQYLSIVTLGAYQGVKVDTSRGQVRPGDLLVSAGTAGQAMVAQPVLVEGVPIFPQGAIVGKLLGPPDPATGLAPIFVTLH